MLAKTIFVFGLVTFLAVPASADQFFIVQDIQKQSCTITQEAPKDEQYTMVGDGAYGDPETAAAEMKTILACNPSDAVASQNPTPPPAKQ
jgi:hypothetical protein